MVVNFRLGRLKNTAPVHKSKLRKRVDFYFGPDGSQSAFWSAFGRPFGSLWDTLGDLGVTLGHLGVTWDPLGLLWGALGCPLGSLLRDLDVFFTVFVQKFSKGPKKSYFLCFLHIFRGFLKILSVFSRARPPKAGRVCWNPGANSRKL